MEVNGIPQVLLNSGHKMPSVGLGTASSISLSTGEELVSVCIEAIEAGYRHFDTAALYQTEEALGRSVAQALGHGLIKSRDELFITSKLWISNCHHDLVLPALKETLAKLGLEYLDLYLVHWPVRLKPESKGYISSDDVLPFDVQRTWEAMEECSKLGLAKSVGVSNFSCQKLSKILEHATVPPAVNQVEMNVAWRQQKMLKFCKKTGIHVNAYSPLSGKGTFWGTCAVIESPILKDIGVARGKKVAQVLVHSNFQVALRWILEQGASVTVKSFNKERMRENLEVFNWELKEDDRTKIEMIQQRKSESSTKTAKVLSRPKKPEIHSFPSCQD